MQGGPILKLFIAGSSVLRTLLYPVLYLFMPFLPPLKRRWEFEQKNWADPISQSFKSDGRKAHLAFEVSSDGELEQILPIIKILIGQQKFLEILYCSPSVERKIEVLAGQFPGHIRAKRMPLVTYFPKFFRIGQNIERWLTAPCLVLVRYDFFPELLAYGLLKGRSMILVNGTLKNKNFALFPNFLRFFFWNELARSFDLITVPDPDDKIKFEALGAARAKIHVIEFRALQIEERISRADKILEGRLPASYLAGLNKLGKGSCLMFGQIYLQDLEIFIGPKFLQMLVERKLHLCLVPHNLDAKNIGEMQALLRQLLKKHNFEGLLPMYTVGPAEPNREYCFPSITLLSIKGILCELFTRFEISYIGGGFERAIHSVLEPFLAGSQVFCGPKTHRSTEFDYISRVQPEVGRVVESEEEFLKAILPWLNQRPGEQGKRNTSALNMSGFLKHLEELC